MICVNKGAAGYGKRQIVPRLPRLRPQHNSSEQPRRCVSSHRTNPEQWTSIPVPAIIDEALFEAVQEQLKENKQRQRLAAQGPKYLLQGLVVCQGCGYAMCGGRKERRLFYRCVGNVVHRMSGQRVCRSRYVRGEPLEAAIWADVSGLLVTPRRIEQEYHRRLSLGDQQNTAPDHHKRQMMINRAQRQISTLIDAYSEGLIDKAEFEPRIRGARQYLEKLQAERQSQEQLEAQVREMRLVIGRLEAFAEKVRGSLDDADWATRRHLISTLVKRIEVGEEQVRVVYRVDCGPFDVTPSGGQDCWRRRDGSLRLSRAALASATLRRL